MDVILTKLVFHRYTDERLLEDCIPNCLKKNGFEWDKNWNENSIYSSDIKQHDIVFSIREMNEKEDYAFIFIDVQKAIEGNLKYSIKKIILEETLSEDMISWFCSIILNKLEDNVVIKYYIVGEQCYPYYQSNKKSAIDKIIQEIINSVKFNRYGIDAFPEFIERIKKQN